MEKEINTMLVEALEKIANNGFKTSDSDVYMVMASDCAKNALSQYSTLTAPADKPVLKGELRKVDFKGREVVIFFLFYRDETGEQYTTTELDELNIEQLDIYHKKMYGDEIEGSISEGEGEYITQDQYRKMAESLNKPALKLIKDAGVPFEKWADNIQALIQKELGLEKTIVYKRVNKKQ